MSLFVSYPVYKVQLNHGVDHNAAVRLLKERLAQIPNVRRDPAPDVEILEFNLAGPVLAVRPYCHTDHYWHVYFDTNRAVRENFGSAGFPVPEQHLVLRNGVSAGLSADEAPMLHAVGQQPTYRVVTAATLDTPIFIIGLCAAPSNESIFRTW
jgi:hypothetical protein